MGLCPYNPASGVSKGIVPSVFLPEGWVMIMDLEYHQSLGEELKQRIPVFRSLKFKVVEAKEGHVILEVKHDPMLEREGGMLFGGIIALLFDATMGLSVYTVRDGDDQATISLSIDFLKPARAERYLVEGHVVRRGRRIVFVEGSLSDGRDIFARAHGVWYIKRSDR